jgi:PAS domain S-box-containing protein
MVGISRDISERRRVQAAFRRWGQIFENAEFGIVIGGADGETVELMNPTFAQMHGYSVEEFTGSRFRDVFEPEEWDQFKKHLVAAREKGHHTFESKQLRKDGSSFPVMMDVTTVKDHAGKVMYHIIHVQDITERKQIEAQAKEAYRKEVLLKEIHHRVKNNLQMVSSMLSLQTTYIKDKKTLNVFTESQNRIRTITLIHEILYQSKDLGNIEMHNYFQTLVDSLVRSYRRNPSKIRQHIDAENVSLGIDTAIPCALIVNELVSNCLKHAFTASRGGSIWIDLQRSTDGAYCLKVRDNGIGFPGGLNYRATESLGLQLVMMFVEQLDADIRMTSRPGTAFMINFRESEYAERK